MPHRREVSRVEGFSDAVFAFAITLLVVSLEVPKTFDELVNTIRGFPAFAICFALLFQVWWRHYQFFRSYDLEDAYVVAWTGVLLFVVLFYVYPLKFMWSLLFGDLQRRGSLEVMAVRQTPALLAIYGIGLIPVFSILAILYFHAYRLRKMLDLSSAEALDARVRVYSNLAIALWGVASIAVAFALGAARPRLAGLAGFVYSGIGLSEWALGVYRDRLFRRLAEAKAKALQPVN